MALSNYTELQAAILEELDSDEADLTAATADLVKRCESKLNRRLRLRNMEQQATATYEASTTTRRLAMPTTMLEMLDLWIKPSTAEDSKYQVLRQVSPLDLPDYYGETDVVAYAWRNDIEFNRAPSVDQMVKMHYIKKLNIASDSTNWLLTNFPDVYLYGSLVEAEVFRVNDERIPVWRTFFEEAVDQLNKLDQRSRNDVELNIRGAARMATGRGGFNILTGR